MTKTIRIRGARFMPAAALALLFTAGLFIKGPEAAGGAVSGLLLCGQIVIPSLFPFMAAALFISKSGLADLMGRLAGPVAPRLFKLPGAAAPSCSPLSPGILWGRG